MVKIIGYKERHKQDGEKFYVLEVQGGIEMIKSQSTGNFYATAKKATVLSTFDEQTCSALIGTEMQGAIIKEECKPYDYVVRETGEEITLYHRWTYIPDEIIPKVENIPNSIKADINSFSENGVMEFA